MNNLFKEEAITIWIYVYKETVDDPEENNKILTKACNGIPIKAVVTDLLSSQVQWRMPGITTSKAKILLIKENKLALIELSHKMKIKNDYYIGWKDNSKLQYRELGDYVEIYAYSK